MTPPLRPIETLLLTMLAAGDRHGYGLRQDILDHTGGEIELEPGNLYRHLRRLEADGAVAVGGRRRAEALTSGGSTIGSPRRANASWPRNSSGSRPWSAWPSAAASSRR